MRTNQEARHQSIQAITGTSGSYNEDWVALFDLLGIASGDFNGRFIAWLQLATGSSKTNINDLTNEYATQLGFDNWSTVTYIAPVSLGVQLWLDANESTTIVSSSGSVSKWKDKSGNANHATQGTGSAQPTTGSSTINGKNALSFDGGDFLGLDQPSNLDFTPGTDEFTIFAVCNVPVGEQGAIVSKAGATTNQRQYHFIYIDDHATGIIGGSSKDYPTDITSTPQVLTLEVSTSGQELFINGTSDGTGSIGTATNSADVLIGARRSNDSNGGSAFLLTGDIGEIIIYNRNLTATERAAVESYLSNKWIDTYIEVLMLGASKMDSVSQGNVLQSLINTTYGSNVAIVDESTGGWTTTNLKNNIDSIISSNTTATHALLNIGGNNVTATRPYSTATTEEKDTITDDLNYIVAALQTAGIEILPSSLGFSNYDGTTVASPENGVLPYSTNLINPILCAAAPNYCYESGLPYSQLYELILNDYTTYLDVDNIHWTSAGKAAVQQHFVDTLFLKLLTGVDPEEI